MMFATSISSAGRLARKLVGGWKLCLVVTLTLIFVHPVLAAETNLVSSPSLQVSPDHSGALTQIFQTARTRFRADPNHATNAWQFGRACFDLAELATNSAVKAGIAEQGIAACRQAILRQPASAPAHYYLGMTIGQLADTRRNMAALKMVKEMEREFITMRELDEHFDFAGADRNLGLLYFESPTFISIGSRSKARQHLQRAVELAPDFPENRLNLIETLLKWGDTADARREFKALEQLLPTLKLKFPGEAWSEPPANWQKRLDAVQKKIVATK